MHAVSERAPTVGVPKPLRIEMILPALPQGGMEMVVARLAGQLVDRGHEVTVTCLEEGGPLADEFLAKGIRVNVIPTLGLRTNLRAPALERYLRARAPDVVHSHSGVWMKAAHAARRAGVCRVVHTVHGLLDDEPWHGRMLKRLAARYTDVAVAVSAPLRSYLEVTCGIRAAQLRVIANGVDSGRFKPVSRGGDDERRMRRRLAGEWAASPLVGHVARLVPIKNQRLLIDAFRLVLDRAPDAKLLIVGDGPLKPTLEAHAEDIGILSSVRFTGAQSRVHEWLPGLDLFVLSSDAEGTSMSVLEALASGVCVVATAVGGTPDLLAHGNAGILVPARNARALADGMLTALMEPTRRAALASAGRRMVEASFDEHDVVSQYELLYRGAA
jgi:glycosyltransferase involved in cell wall biosynthesis